MSAGHDGRFIVTEAGTGEKVNDVFVLRYTIDKAARIALAAYAEATPNEKVAMLVRRLLDGSRRTVQPRQERGQASRQYSHGRWV